MPGIDFEQFIDNFTLLSPRAQSTFLFQLNSKLGPAVARTNLKYAMMRLDDINSKLPLDHPNRQRYEERQRARNENQFVIGVDPYKHDGKVESAVVTVTKNNGELLANYKIRPTILKGDEQL